MLPKLAGRLTCPLPPFTSTNLVGPVIAENPNRLQGFFLAHFSDLDGKNLVDCGHSAGLDSRE
jgi:hypothetical protein